MLLTLPTLFVEFDSTQIHPLKLTSTFKTPIQMSWAIQVKIVAPIYQPNSKQTMDNYFSTDYRLTRSFD